VACSDFAGIGIMDIDDNALHLRHILNGICAGIRCVPSVSEPSKLMITHLGQVVRSLSLSEAQGHDRLVAVLLQVKLTACLF
jgi:hypothetical protein